MSRRHGMRFVAHVPYSSAASPQELRERGARELATALCDALSGKVLYRALGSARTAWLTAMLYRARGLLTW